MGIQWSRVTIEEQSVFDYASFIYQTKCKCSVYYVINQCNAIASIIKSKKGTYTVLDEKCYLWPATSRVFFATKNARNCLAMVITLKCFST